MTSGQRQQHWIGAQLTRYNITAILFGATLGALIPALQPILLGSLQLEGRLTISQMGQTATLELVGMALANGIAGARIKLRHLRPIGIVTGITLAAVNLATVFLSGSGLMAARALSGACCGIYLWMLVGMLARAHVPARWTGIYVILQAVAALILAAVFSGQLVPRFGVNGAFVSLSIVAVVMAGASALLPSHFTDLPGTTARLQIPGLSGITALAAVFFYMAAILAVWLYLGPLSRETGHPQKVTALAFQIAIAMQIAGGFGAIVLAQRAKPMVVICIGAIGSAVIALSAVSGPPPSIFIVTIAVFGFLWMFAIPFQIPLLIEADPTRNAVMLGGSAQLFGYAAGPFLASLIVQSAGTRAPLLLGAALFLVSVALAAASTNQRATKVLAT